MLTRSRRKKTAAMKSPRLRFLVLLLPALWLCPAAQAQYAMGESVLVDRNGDGQMIIYAFGDSITRGVGDDRPTGTYVDSILETQSAGDTGYPLRIELLLGVSVMNLGSPGERLVRTGVYRFARAIPNSTADIVFISEGSNDAIDMVNSTVYHRTVQTMINITKAFGKTPVLGTIVPTCREHSSLAPHITSYNARIRELAVVNDVPLADTYQAFANTCNISDCHLLNEPEGLHPNGVGYTVYGESVIARLLGIDLLAPDGPTLLEQALGLEPGTVLTVPNAAEEV